MTYETFLEKLAPKLNLPEIKPMGPNGQCPLSLNGKYQIYLEKSADPNTFFLYGALCPIPANGRLELYDLLMSAHLMGVATAGASFGAAPKIGQVLMYRSFDLAHLEIEAFEKALQAFVGVYVGWLEEIAKAMKPGPTAQNKESGTVAQA